MLDAAVNLTEKFGRREIRISKIHVMPGTAGGRFNNIR
jgi:hypothetical protein